MIQVSVMAGMEHMGTVPVEISKFPCGESKVVLNTAKIPFGLEADQLSVNLRYESDQDLVDLLLVVDAIKRSELRYKDFVLLVDYFPYSRQDRKCNHGEPHSLKVVAGLINSCAFDKVFVTDPHSDVIEGVVDNCEPFSVEDIMMFEDNIGLDQYDALVSPDAGAYKKVSKVAGIHGHPVIRADKIRDTQTGDISGIEVYDDGNLRGKRVIIIDDICDGGGTFVGLAQKLIEKGCDSVDLYITHGMFTKGVELLLKEIDNIYCYGYYGPKGEVTRVETVTIRVD